VPAHGVGQELAPLRALTARGSRHENVTQSERHTRSSVIHRAPMRLIGRRAFAGAALLLPAAFYSVRASATLFRGLPLPRLVALSEHVLMLTGLDARCVYVPLAGRRAIVTETRARVEEVFTKAAPASHEVIVRTLGGVLDGVGELTHGQAEFAANARCLAFLTRADDASLWVTGMAQGHYPIAGDSSGNMRLLASPRLPTMIDSEHSAVRVLVGRLLPEARRLVQDAGKP